MDERMKERARIGNKLVSDMRSVGVVYRMAEQDPSLNELRRTQLLNALVRYEGELMNRAGKKLRDLKSYPKVFKGAPR